SQPTTPRTKPSSSNRFASISRRGPSTSELLPHSLRPMIGHHLGEQLIAEVVVGSVLRVPLIQVREVALVVIAEFGHALLPFLRRITQRLRRIRHLGLLRSLVRQGLGVGRHLLLHVIIE